MELEVGFPEEAQSDVQEVEQTMNDVVEEVLEKNEEKPIYLLMGQFMDGSQPFLIGQPSENSEAVIKLTANGVGIDNSQLTFTGPKGQRFKLMLAEMVVAPEEKQETEQNEEK